MEPWKKVTPEMVAAFDAALPADPRVERKKMFGCPCAFVNGNMFAGVYKDTFIMRLPEADRAEAAKLGAVAWAPGGDRPMREYSALPETLSPRDLSAWLARAHAYVGAMPPKEKKERKGKKGT